MSQGFYINHSGWYNLIQRPVSDGRISLLCLRLRKWVILSDIIQTVTKHLLAALITTATNGQKLPTGSEITPDDHGGFIWRFTVLFHLSFRPPSRLGFSVLFFIVSWYELMSFQTRGQGIHSNNTQEGILNWDYWYNSDAKGGTVKCFCCLNDLTISRSWKTPGEPPFQEWLTELGEADAYERMWTRLKIFP